MDKKTNTIKINDSPRSCKKEIKAYAFGIPFTFVPVDGLTQEEFDRLCDDEIEEETIETAKWKKYLKSKNVECVDQYNITLRCCECGQEWSPNVKSGGGFYRGYTRCPNTCNW